MKSGDLREDERGPAASAEGLGPGWLERLTEFADRGRDRPVLRPADAAHALDEVPPPTLLAGLALQQLAIQSIYFLIPGLVAAAFALGHAEATNLLALSVAAIGAAGLLQAATRGPIGAGYPIPAISSPTFLAAYLLAAQVGDPAMAAAATVAAGVFGVAVSLLLPRIETLVPTEVSGVVVFLIGVGLLPRTFAAAAPAGLDGAARDLAVVLALASLAAMVGVALSRLRVARFGVLVGGLAGVAAAYACGLGPEGAGAALAEAPWFALPAPRPPSPGDFDAALAVAFGVTMVAALANTFGDLVAFQRAADGAWARPDLGPVRRGLLAGSLGIAGAGLGGAIAPSPSSACVGLAIGTRSFSRAPTVAAAAALLALACCPKALTLFVLVPDPVKAAMLAYVGCFMMAAGCQLVTARMLDARRTFVTGLGLLCGFGALLAPELFGRLLPVALLAPVTVGALAALLLNLVTLPLVARRAEFAVAFGPGMQQEIVDRCEALGGAWGARRTTMDAVKHSLVELGELLAARGAAGFDVQARLGDDAIGVAVLFDGPPLPRPSPRPAVEDLLGPMEAQEAFAMWLGTRQAQRFGQRLVGGRTELRLEFAD